MADGRRQFVQIVGRVRQDGAGDHLGGLGVEGLDLDVHEVGVVVEGDLHHLSVELEIAVTRRALRQPVQEIEPRLGIDVPQVVLLVQLVRHLVRLDVGLQFGRVGGARSAGTGAAAAAHGAADAGQQRGAGRRRIAPANAEARFRDVQRRGQQEVVDPEDHRRRHHEDHEWPARRHRAEPRAQLLGEDIDRLAPVRRVDGQLLPRNIGHRLALALWGWVNSWFLCSLRLVISSMY